MLEVAPASTKEPRPGPSACQRQRGRARGCHQPSRVTSGGWGREVTATTLHRGETFPSARAALVTKEREQGTACSGWDGGGVTQAVTRVPRAVTRVPKPRQGWIPQPSNGLAERTRSWKRGGTQTPAPPKLLNPSSELCSSRGSGSKPFPSRRAIPPGANPAGVSAPDRNVVPQPPCATQGPGAHWGQPRAGGTAQAGRWPSPWHRSRSPAGSSRPGTEPTGYFYPGICVV